MFIHIAAFFVHVVILAVGLFWLKLAYIHLVTEKSPIGIMPLIFGYLFTAVSFIAPYHHILSVLGEIGGYAITTRK